MSVPKVPSVPNYPEIPIAPMNLIPHSTSIVNCETTAQGSAENKENVQCYNLNTTPGNAASKKTSQNAENIGLARELNRDACMPQFDSTDHNSAIQAVLDPPITPSIRTEEDDLPNPRNPRKWQTGKKWREITGNESGKFTLIDVIEHGLEISTRKRTFDRKLRPRKSQVNVEPFDTKKFMHAVRCDNLSEENNVDVLNLNQEIMTSVSERLTGNSYLRKKLPTQENSTRKCIARLDLRKQESVDLEMEKKTDVTGKGNGTPKCSRKWKFNSTKELGISPKGKIAKKTPGKLKLKSKENFQRLRTLFDPTLQLQVSHLNCYTNPFAVQDPNRSLRPTNGMSGNGLTQDHVTRPGKLLDEARKSP